MPSGIAYYLPMSRFSTTRWYYLGRCFPLEKIKYFVFVLCRDLTILLARDVVEAYVRSRNTGNFRKRIVWNSDYLTAHASQYFEDLSRMHESNTGQYQLSSLDTVNSCEWLWFIIKVRVVYHPMDQEGLIRVLTAEQWPAGSLTEFWPFLSGDRCDWVLLVG